MAKSFVWRKVLAGKFGWRKSLAGEKYQIWLAKKLGEKIWLAKKDLAGEKYQTRAKKDLAAKKVSAGDDLFLRLHCLTV